MGAGYYPGRNAEIYLGESKTCLSDQIYRMDPRLETAPARVCGIARGQGSARSGEGDVTARDFWKAGISPCLGRRAPCPSTRRSAISWKLIGRVTLEA